jgi:spermidine/putrescine transport system ATP-binding protein
MSEGKIQQIGSPIEIYNEPANSFVADFIGESNILNGIMIEDERVEFAGHQFECVDKGFTMNEPVDVVVRPEDIYIFELSDAAQFTGKVTSSIFKGVHYEMMVTTPEGFEFLIQDYHCFEVGKTVGMLVKPFDIQVMKKERNCNTFEGTIVDKTHVRFLGANFECSNTQNLANGTAVKVKVEFGNVSLQDNQEDGMLSGVVSFILYKGNHYHLTISTDNNEQIFADTHDVWDDGDQIGISISAKSIQIENL